VWFANVSSLQTVLCVSRLDPRPVSEFAARLTRAPQGGRSALLLAELGWLCLDRSDAAARLLADVVSGRIEGLTREAIVEYTRRVPPDVCVRAYALSTPRWGIDASLLLAKFAAHDVLDSVAQVRDGASTPREYLYTTGLVHTGFVLAAALSRDYHEPLHRKYGDESLFLLGASPHPELVLREMTVVHIHPGPLPAYDLRIARWCLENPHHTAASRAFSVSLLSAPVVAELCHEGVLSVLDACNWIRPRRSSTFDPQVMLAFTLPDSVPGVRTLRSRLFAQLEHPTAYILALAEDSRRNVLAERYRSLSPDVLEYVLALAPRWRRSLDDLVSAAQKLSVAGGGVPRQSSRSR